MRNAARLAALEINKLDAKHRAAKASAEAHAASSQGLANSFHKLKMETDNVYAGMNRYTRAAELANKIALDQKWSQEQLGAELQRLAMHYGVAEQAGYNMNDQIRSARFHTANMAAQFQDVFVMMASGQSPLMLGIQQGSQMTQVLQTAGGSIKATGALLKDAFMSLVSPVTFLTIGLVAGVAALGQWAMAATGSAEAAEAAKKADEEYKTVVDNLTAAIQRKTDAMRIANGEADTTEQLRGLDRLYQLQNEQTKLLAEQAAIEARMRDLAGSRANQQLQSQKEALAIQQAANAERLNEIDGLLKQLQYETQLNTAARNRANDTRNYLRDAFLRQQELNEATEQQAQRARLAKDQFHLMAGEAAAIQSSLGLSAQSAQDIANANMAAGIAAAADWASTLYKRLSEAAGAAARINNARAAGIGTSLGAGPWAQMANANMSPNTPPIDETGGGAGGGGGGTNPADLYAAELEQLRNSLLNQEQLEMQSYQRRLDLLKNALQERLLSQQEYAGLMERVEATHGFVMQQQTNRNVTMTLNALGQLFQGSKKIGAAIALTNSYIAFTEVLKDPSYIGRPWARFAAAASALSSGLAAVRSIKSGTPGGSTSGGGIGGGGGGAAGGGPQYSTNVSLQLTGGELFSRQQVIKLINAINDATADGAKILLR